MPAAHLLTPTLSTVRQYHNQGPQLQQGGFANSLTWYQDHVVMHHKISYTDSILCTYSVTKYRGRTQAGATRVWRGHQKGVVLVGCVTSAISLFNSKPCSAVACGGTSGLAYRDGIVSIIAYFVGPCQHVHMLWSLIYEPLCEGPGSSDAPQIPCPAGGTFYLPKQCQNSFFHCSSPVQSPLQLCVIYFCTLASSGSCSISRQLNSTRSLWCRTTNVRNLFCSIVK